MNSDTDSIVWMREESSVFVMVQNRRGACQLRRPGRFSIFSAGCWVPVTPGQHEPKQNKDALQPEGTFLKYHGNHPDYLEKENEFMGTGFLQAVAENVQFLLICVVVILAIVGAAELVEVKVLRDNLAQVKKTRYITICGMLGAIAMVLHIFDFPVPFLAPGFYKLDFSEIPVMIGAFYLGPVGGVVIELVKILLKLVIKGTSTAFVGDLSLIHI